MPIKMKRLKIVIGAIFLFIISCRQSIKNEVVESARSFPITLNPILATDEISAGIVDKIFSGLFRFDRKGFPEMDLASSYKLNENELSINLKENILWHDGKPFSSEDVIFTFNLMKDPDSPFPYKSDIEFIDRIEQINKNTLKITFKNKFAPYLTYLTFKILPSHILRKINSIEKFGENPIGTGPYKFEKIIPENKIVLSSFSKYFGGEPNIKKYTLVLNTDSLLTPLKLLNEEINLGEIEPEVALSIMNKTEFFKKINFNFYKKNSYTYLVFNLEKHPLNLREIRMAIVKSINRDSLLKNILRNYGEIPYSHIILKDWKNKNLKRYKFDPINSKKEIEKYGKEIKLTLLTNSESLLRKNVSTSIAKCLEDIGIIVKLEFIEYRTFLQKLKKGNFDMAISSVLFDLDPNISDVFHSEGVMNYSSFKSRELDKLLIMGKFTIELSQRKKIYDKVQEILWDEMPIFPLFSPFYIMGSSKKLDLKITPEIIGSTNSFSSFLNFWEIKN
ncbi:MAG: ABC transporter substrate-binding protein [Acidobacteriota bacterium]